MLFFDLEVEKKGVLNVATGCGGWRWKLWFTQIIPKAFAKRRLREFQRTTSDLNKAPFGHICQSCNPLSDLIHAPR